MNKVLVVVILAGVLFFAGCCGSTGSGINGTTSSLPQKTPFEVKTTVHITGNSQTKTIANESMAQLDIVGNTNQIRVLNGAKIGEVTIVGNSNNVNIDEGAIIDSINIVGNTNSIQLPITSQVKITQTGSGNKVERFNGSSGAGTILPTETGSLIASSCSEGFIRSSGRCIEIMNVSYTELLRNYEKYKGKAITKFGGKVSWLSTLEKPQDIIMVVYSSPAGAYSYLDSYALCVDEYSGDRVLKDDIISVSGEVTGLCKLSDGSMVPAVNAINISIRN